MKLSLAQFYPAAASNYSKGRLYPIDRITIHHTAGLETTLRYLWGDPTRNASSHFFVHPDYIEQYVDTDDTAWCNGSLDSNNRSISIEVRGDWRNGFYDDRALAQLRRLLRELRGMYPNARLTYHRDEIDRSVYPGGTICPADLKDRGYAQSVWDLVTNDLFPQPKPTPRPEYTARAIAPKRVQLKRAANLWNFNFATWSSAQAVKPYPQGHIIDVVAEATNSLGAKYYMTAYTFNDGNLRATNGFNVADCDDYIEIAPPVPPVNEPTVPVTPPVVPTTPINTNPTIPTDSDQLEKRVAKIELFINSLLELLAKVLSGDLLKDLSNKWRQ